MSKNTKPQQHGSYQHSSGGCSTASSSVDLKCTQKRPQQPNPARNQNEQQQHQQQQSSNAGRSRSFLHCLGKHLGRHFSQHQIYQLRSERSRGASHMLAVYNSEEDVRSSSTDSFSLSYERYGTAQAAQRTPHRHMNCDGGSTADLTGEERSSGTSSAASAYSRLSSNTAGNFIGEMEEVWPKRNERHHFYLDTSNMYRRPVSALGHMADDNDDDGACYSDNCQGNDRDADNDNDSDDDTNATKATTTKLISKQHVSKSSSSSSNHTNAADNVISIAPKKQHAQAPATTTPAPLLETKSNAKKYGKHIETPPPSRSRSASPCSITKGLHLSRISIASSVCRMFQHFNINSSSSATTSTRSLSCSSTPLRGPSSFKSDTSSSNSNNKKSSKHSKTCANSTTGLSKSRSTSFSIISSSSASNSKKKEKKEKKEKKQQSILRPPVSYVYMKGMSGLYSRVPRYTVSSPYRAA